MRLIIPPAPLRAVVGQPIVAEIGAGMQFALSSHYGVTAPKNVFAT
jgi:hypothetical protein